MMTLPFRRDVPSPQVIENVKVLHSDFNTINTLADKLYLILGQIPSHQPVIIICVGTDRSTGDSLGPMVGTYLEKQLLHGVQLYGTLDQPVHAVNLRDTLESIQSLNHNPFIIAIDACLGQLSSVGFIQIGNGPVKPGAGVNKDLPPVGNMHITGIVNVGGFMEYFVLQNTRLSLVMHMAEVIAQSFQIAFSSLQRFTAASFAQKIEG